MTIFSLNTSSIRFKPQLFLGLILLIIFNFAAHANDDLEERLYTNMTDSETQMFNSLNVRCANEVSNKMESWMQGGRP